MSQKFIQDPYSATMGGFSKVTHFLRDTLITTDRSGVMTTDHMSPSGDLMTSSQLTTSDLAPTSLAVNSLSEAGFELITAVSVCLACIQYEDVMYILCMDFAAA